MFVTSSRLIFVVHMGRTEERKLIEVRCSSHSFCRPASHFPCQCRLAELSNSSHIAFRRESTSANGPIDLTFSTEKSCLSMKTNFEQTLPSFVFYCAFDQHIIENRCGSHWNSSRHGFFQWQREGQPKTDLSFISEKAFKLNGESRREKQKALRRSISISTKRSPRFPARLSAIEIHAHRIVWTCEMIKRRTPFWCHSPKDVEEISFGKRRHSSKLTETDSSTRS